MENYHEIGVPFDYDGTTLVATESKSCIGCYFRVRSCDGINCTAGNREDNKSVMFVKHKEETSMNTSDEYSAATMRKITEESVKGNNKALFDEIKKKALNGESELQVNPEKVSKNLQEYLKSIGYIVSIYSNHVTISW